MSKPYDPRDHYYRKARKDGLRARSAFKIDEIEQRFHLFKGGAKVLDLGAAPGGWLQIIAKAVGPTGFVLGVDLEPIAGVGRNVRTEVLDLRAPDAAEKIRGWHPAGFDVVTSDMAPKTTGIRMTDEVRSLELVRLALAVADAQLAQGGSFVAKVFEGGDFEVLLREIRAAYGTVKLVRPDATRDRSREVFVVATGKRA
jgi:23S rRNA (uridine2552-2'-O)-methyltransferase